MKIAINTLPFHTGGPLTHMNNMLPEFAKTDDEYFVLVPAGRNEIEIPDSKNIKKTPVEFPVKRNLSLRFVYEQVLLPIKLRQLNIDVLYQPNGITSLASPCPTVTTIRNIKPYLTEKSWPLRNRSKQALRRFWYKMSGKTAKEIIFVSECTKKLVLPRLNTSDRKSNVVYHGLDTEFFSKRQEWDKDRIPQEVKDHDQYLLCVAVINNHKNIETLLKGFAKIEQSLREKHPLLIAGGFSDEVYEKRILKLVKELDISDDIVFLGRVDHDVIPYLYQNARLSIIPSKMESFGFPVIESMAAGTPVVAANATAIPEIGGDAVVLFDPESPEDLAETVSTVLPNEKAIRRLQVASTRRASNFSWKKTADETHKVLHAAKETQD